MRNQKALCVLVALILAGASQAQVAPDAFEETTPEKSAGVQTDYWARTLGLTRAQVAEVRALNLEFATSARAAAVGAETEATKLQLIEAAEAERQEDMLDVLTESQRARYQDFLEKRDLWIQRHVHAADAPSDQ